MTSPPHDGSRQAARGTCHGGPGVHELPAARPAAGTADLATGHQEGWQAKTTRPARPARLPSKVTSTSASERGNTRLRIFVCGHCSTAEVVPWCGQAPDCGHPACTDALARCAARHQLDGRRFHGPVSVIMIDSHLWDGHSQAADQAS